MGWIVAALMAAIASVALGLLWRRYQQDVERLRSQHQSEVRRIGEEHQARLTRIDRENDRQLESAHHPMARDLFPAIDSLDVALEHFDEEQDQRIIELRTGIELARAALDDALARHGITTIVADEGELFDPEIHEAISRIEVLECEVNSVRRVYRRGYRHGQRVLRSAMVEVNVPAGEPHGADDFEEPRSSVSIADSEDIVFSELEAEPEPEPEPEGSDEADSPAPDSKGRVDRSS